MAYRPLPPITPIRAVLMVSPSCSDTTACQAGCCKGRAHYAMLRDDCRPHAGGDVKRGIEDGIVGGHEGMAAAPNALPAPALLDRNSVRHRRVLEIDGRGRRHHVERDPCASRRQGDTIGADLVGHVAVRGNAVRADEDGLDSAQMHGIGGHIVCDQGERDAGAPQFPGGQSRTLQQWPGLIDVDME